jgi:hypothetical protein
MFPLQCAEVYANGQAEEITGQALKELGVERSEIVVSTKLYFGSGSSAPTARGLSRKHIIEGTKGAGGCRARKGSIATVTSHAVSAAACTAASLRQLRSLL